MPLHFRCLQCSETHGYLGDVEILYNAHKIWAGFTFISLQLSQSESASRVNILGWSLRPWIPLDGDYYIGWRSWMKWSGPDTHPAAAGSNRRSTVVYPPRVAQLGRYSISGIPGTRETRRKLTLSIVLSFQRRARIEPATAFEQYLQTLHPVGMAPNSSAALPMTKMCGYGVVCVAVAVAFGLRMMLEASEVPSEVLVGVRLLVGERDLRQGGGEGVLCELRIRHLRSNSIETRASMRAAGADELRARVSAR
ncbi:hypothetical protein C8R45DRAFT_921768 [Mycena sanguinolenta]|nr:hypothetical protein C8R45DRAFT_921768 [Mycena sanguinolenta]